MMEPAIWQLWWVWAAAAVAFAIAETLVPGFIFLGFAIGAGVTALVVLLPVSPGLTVLIALFAGLSLARGSCCAASSAARTIRPA